MASFMPHTLPKKNVSSVDDYGNVRSILAWKYERFIFDAFPYAKSIVALQVRAVDPSYVQSQTSGFRLNAMMSFRP